LRAVGSDLPFLIFDAESAFLLLMKIPDFGDSFVGEGGGGEAAFGNGVSRSSATEDLRFPFFFISLNALKISGAEYGFWNCEEGGANFVVWIFMVAGILRFKFLKCLVIFLSTSEILSLSLPKV